MITRLRASGLLSFGEPGIDVRPGPLNVLIGANGTGKTNVLRLLELLRTLAARGKRRIGRPPSTAEWKHHALPEDWTGRLDVELAGVAGGGTLRHVMTLEDVDGRLQVGEERYHALDRKGGEKAAGAAAAAAAREAYGRIRISPAQVSDERAAVMRLLDEHRDDGCLEMAAVAAAEADERLGGDEAEAVERLRRAVAKLDAGDRLSAGTMRYVRRSIDLGCGHGRTTAIDNPESGCHPDLVARLAKAAVEASADGQVFLTTHSGVLVDAMGEHPEAVLVCERLGDRTIVEPLNVPHVAALLRNEGLGSIWSRGGIGGNRW